MHNFFWLGSSKHGFWGEAEAKHIGAVQERERGQAAGERLIMVEWFGLIGCESVHRGRPRREQNDDQFGDRTSVSPRANPSSHNTITPMLLTLCTSVIPHFHHSLCQPFTISASLSPLCVASHATGCWIIDGMLSLRDFSCRRLVCWPGCALSSLTTVTLHWRACVCTPPTWVRICVWLIKSPDALLRELFKSARVLVSKPRLDFQDVWAACRESNTRSLYSHYHEQCFLFFFFR